MDHYLYNSKFQIHIIQRTNLLESSFTFETPDFWISLFIDISYQKTLNFFIFFWCLKLRNSDIKRVQFFRPVLCGFNCLILERNSFFLNLLKVFPLINFKFNLLEEFLNFYFASPKWSLSLLPLRLLETWLRELQVPIWWIIVDQHVQLWNLSFNLENIGKDRLAFQQFEFYLHGVNCGC